MKNFKYKIKSGLDILDEYAPLQSLFKALIRDTIHSEKVYILNNVFIIIDDLCFEYNYVQI
jgi:hypothetical protein